MTPQHTPSPPLPWQATASKATKQSNPLKSPPVPSSSTKSRGQEHRQADRLMNGLKCTIQQAKPYPCLDGDCVHLTTPRTSLSPAPSPPEDTSSWSARTMTPYPTSSQVKPTRAPLTTPPNSSSSRTPPPPWIKVPQPTPAAPPGALAKRVPTRPWRAFTPPPQEPI